MLLRIVLVFGESDGPVTAIKILSNPGYGTAEEAVRVLKRLKGWQPGKQQEIPVRVSYTLPIIMNFN
ncbi:energy transducer TonB [Desertivirga arenae]|uniref:energy transducer TonB n=1 Tax=Desertivirga arenae TaxID=2810309 RepID=UPI001A9730EA|nr:energy transducer TonB [Pedobacter sp. SYSU D00823]